MNARLITVAEHARLVTSHLSVAGAARRLGVSESTIRRAARALGVTRIAGPTVAGFILLDESSRLPIVIAYHA